MSNQPLTTRIVLAIVRSRFEPVETILAISAMLHGLWLLFPYWGLGGSEVGETISGTARIFELSLGSMMFILGLLHIIALARGLQRLRYNVAFLKFMAWFFFTVISVVAAGFSSIIWITFFTLSLISASVYLNVSARTEGMRDRL